jgi:hypothetical protein
MEPREFTLKALDILGARLTAEANGLYLAEENGAREYIRFEERINSGLRTTLYDRGTPAFQRLVNRIVVTGIHEVEDLDRDPEENSKQIAGAWLKDFGAQASFIETGEVFRGFHGTALLRVRATVAHDSYERLVEIPCSDKDHRTPAGRPGLHTLPRVIERPESLGIRIELLKHAAGLDEGLSEFARFYLERREYETKRAGNERKRKKLEDEFTPRLEMTLVGLQGKLHREVTLKARYKFESAEEYETFIAVTPHDGNITHQPEFGLCAKSGRSVPTSCLAKCEITGAEVLQHLLLKSDVSGRSALPEFTVVCAHSGKRLFRDEADISAVTGKLISSDLLKVSALSGKRAEPEHFGTCAFTNDEFLMGELAMSDISGKSFRIDQGIRSIVSGKTGHKQEFAICHETRQPIALDEAERCEITGHLVRIGVLGQCELSNKKVLPIGLDRCAVTGKRALKRFLVSSSLSGVRILEEIAIRSAGGLFCAPSEAKACTWSGRKIHPGDVRKCELIGLPIHYEFATSVSPYRLLPLVEMLDGVRRNLDQAEKWHDVAQLIAAANSGGKYSVEAAILSPDSRHLVTCSELRTMLGMRVYQVGALFDLVGNTIVGRICTGRRSRGNWIENTH